MITHNYCFCSSSNTDKKVQVRNGMAPNKSNCFDDLELCDFIHCYMAYE